ncbi:hypothetical protein BGX38DRAFT_1229437 [Terfezia claveryi]|nr:hypothetical protein BGX38DRAFT_1229437 [Terfezia claveryi]
MIDKPAVISRLVGPPILSAGAIIQTFTREVQAQSPVRRASSISNHNEPSPVGRSITHPSPKHQRDNSNTAPMGEAVQGPLAAAAIASWLQAMMHQQQQQQGDGDQQFILAELIQNASYTHYRHLTCEQEYRAAQAETAKHSTHFPQFPAIRERYTSAEQKKETAYCEAKKEAIEAAAKLNLFLQSLTSSVVSKRNNTDTSKDALRLSKDAVRVAEEAKRGVDNIDQRFKKHVERESSKPPAADSEALKRLQDEVKQLKAGNQAMKLDFQQYKTDNEKAMKGYEERLERFLATQDGFRNDIGKMREEREVDKRGLNEVVEERKKEKESEMDIDTEPGKGGWKVGGMMEGILSALEGRIMTMEKALTQIQAFKPELKVSTSNTSIGTQLADAPPWLPSDFHNRWDALLAETRSIQEKLALCDKAVEKADIAMTSSHDAIAEEIGSLQDSIDKLTSQTTETSESLQKFTTEASSTLENLTSDTSSIITTRLPEIKSQLQQELGAAWSETFGKLDTRVSVVEKNSTKHSQYIELLSRTVQPLPEKLNHLQSINERVNVLENYRDAIEVTLQGINNQMNNFQFKEIAEKVANLIGVQRVAVVERELNNLRAQVTGLNGLITATHQGQKVQAQQAQAGKQPQQGQQAQGQMKNGEGGPTMMNGTSAPAPSASPVNTQQLQAMQILQQQQYQQLSNNLQTSVNSTRDINTRMTNLEGHFTNIQTLLTTMAQLPPCLAGLEKRVETQEGKISTVTASQIWTSIPTISNKIITLETQMRAIDGAMNAIKESLSSAEGEMRKLHESLATVELKLANSEGERVRERVSASNSAAPALSAGYLEEYASGNLESLTSDLRDLRKQFETKVDHNLKQWASKVKENIQKINRDVKDLTTRVEEFAGSEEGQEGQRRVAGMRRRAELQGLEGREGSAVSGRGSRGGSMDVDPPERGGGGR